MLIIGENSLTQVHSKTLPVNLPSKSAGMFIGVDITNTDAMVI